MMFPTSRAIGLACVTVLVAATTQAHAQVVRCTDPATGKVTYTDGACSSGAAAREVEARKSPEELQLERDRAAEALERKQRRLAAEAAADADARREADRDRTRTANPPVHDYARSPECARARRNLDTALSEASNGTYEQNLRVDAAQRKFNLDCLGPAGYAEAEKARATAAANAPPPVVILPQRHPPQPAPPQPAPPKKFVQCNVFRCYDAHGNSTPR